MVEQLFLYYEKLGLQLQTAWKWSLVKKYGNCPNVGKLRKKWTVEIADIKNYHGKPICNRRITAAKFLRSHSIDAASKLAHLDIAGVAYGD